MANIQSFEITLTPSSLSGQGNWFELPGGGDYDAVVTNPNPPYIQDDQAWQIRLQKLTQIGAVFGSLTSNKWVATAHFEKIGAGEGPASMSTSFPVNGTPKHTYPDQIIDIAPGAVPVGIYIVYLELEMVDKNGLVPMTGFVRLGEVKITNA